MERHIVFQDAKTDTVKMPIPSSLFYRFSALAIQISTEFFVHIDKLILKFIRKGSRASITIIILKKKMTNKFGELTLSNFKAYSKAPEVKTAGHW